jgi:hypothetical protein
MDVACFYVLCPDYLSLTMAVGCGPKCSKLLLFIFNLVFWVCVCGQQTAHLVCCIMCKQHRHIHLYTVAKCDGQLPSDARHDINATHCFVHITNTHAEDTNGIILTACPNNASVTRNVRQAYIRMSP